MRNLGLADRWVGAAGSALSTLAGHPKASRPNPAAKIVADESNLSESDKQLSGALMRVNHVGEVCAQALYQSQALLAQDDTVRRHLLSAAQEEIDHLVWTRERLAQLGARTSVLNPMWFAGSFAIGLLFGRLSPRVNLGFVVETERQVEAHLARHLNQLPAHDVQSRAICQQMQADEAAHAAQALRDGAEELPLAAKTAMRAVSKVMTKGAYYF
jgi:3-demethoxyubiquinol 3-hydroxylase